MSELLYGSVSSVGGGPRSWTPQPQPNCTWRMGMSAHLESCASFILVSAEQSLQRPPACCSAQERQQVLVGGTGLLGQREKARCPLRQQVGSTRSSLEPRTGDQGKVEGSGLDFPLLCP